MTTFQTAVNAEINAYVAAKQPPVSLSLHLTASQVTALQDALHMYLQTVDPLDEDAEDILGMLL